MRVLWNPGPVTFLGCPSPQLQRIHLKGWLFKGLKSGNMNEKSLIESMVPLVYPEGLNPSSASRSQLWNTQRTKEPGTDYLSKRPARRRGDQRTASQ